MYIHWARHCLNRVCSLTTWYMIDIKTSDLVNTVHFTLIHFFRWRFSNNPIIFIIFLWQKLKWPTIFTKGFGAVWSCVFTVHSRLDDRVRSKVYIRMREHVLTCWIWKGWPGLGERTRRGDIVREHSTPFLNWPQRVRSFHRLLILTSYDHFRIYYFFSLFFSETLLSGIFITNFG